MILDVIVFILFICYGSLFLFYRWGWHRIKPEFVPGSFIPRTKITVVIPARNEAAAIPHCLSSILSNAYPASLLEILVIDDFSTDATGAIAAELLADRGRVLYLNQYLSPDERINAFKKKALSIAIKEASGALIVTTDADCRVSSDWLRHLAFAYENTDSKFIVAPVAYHQEQESALLFYFQSLDFITMQGITAAAAALKSGNMCNGANLAFDKAAFFEVGGYSGIDHIASGDDMLLMNKIRQQYPASVFYLKSKSAIVRTAAQKSWRSFLNQRIRWASKTGNYNDWKISSILLLVYLFNLGLCLLFIAGFSNRAAMIVFGGIFVGKILIELYFLLPVARFFKKKNELLYFPLLQPLHILYIIVAGFLGKFGTYEWKGRKVN